MSVPVHEEIKHVNLWSNEIRNTSTYSNRRPCTVIQHSLLKINVIPYHALFPLAVVVHLGVTLTTVQNGESCRSAMIKWLC